MRTVMLSLSLTVIAVCCVTGCFAPWAVANAARLSVQVLSDEPGSFRCTLNNATGVVAEQTVQVQRLGAKLCRTVAWNVPSGCGYWASAVPVGNSLAKVRRTAAGCTVEGRGKDKGRNLGTIVFHRPSPGTSATTTTPAGTDNSDASLQVWLSPANPNPTTGGTKWQFRLAHPGSVRLEVFDVSGRRVNALADGVLAAGEHAVYWNGRDESGRLVANGIYLCRLSTEGRIQRSRALMLR